MDVSFTEICEKLSNKVNLHKSFPTCDGDTTISIKLAVTFVLVPQFLNSHKFNIIATFIPRVGIVAISTTHGASLEKNHHAHAWTINRTHRFNRMNTSCHSKPRLDLLMECTRNNFVLLLFCQFAEVHCVTRYTNS